MVASGETTFWSCGMNVFFEIADAAIIDGRWLQRAARDSVIRKFLFQSLKNTF
jgi:hypothetical protein